MSFLGYGSAEKLEAALTREGGADFMVYTEGLCYASVCSSLDQAEVAARMCRRPSGTTGGWTLSDHNKFADGKSNPCPCELHPETHKHYLFAA